MNIRMLTAMGGLIDGLPSIIEQLVQQHGEKSKMKLEAELEAQAKRLEVELAEEQIDNEVKRTETLRQLDDDMLEREFQRNLRKAEFVKKYQEDMSTLIANMQRVLGSTSIELRSRMEDMILEKTREYKRLQEEAKLEFKEDLKNLNEFGDDEESKKMFREIAYNQVNIILENTRQFMDMMNKDLANMQNNLDKITNQSVENSEFLLRQMGFSKSIGQGSTDNSSNFPTTR